MQGEDPTLSALQIFASSHKGTQVGSGIRLGGEKRGLRDAGENPK